ncbi:MAG: hypothetical protein Tsb0014_10960 [Pleurocapsa sp.]
MSHVPQKINCLSDSIPCLNEVQINNFSGSDPAENVILVVDDTPSNLQLLFTYLEKYGYKVLVTQTGEDALRIARTVCPDLILLDVLMPGLDGFATSVQLKSNIHTRDIPIVFLTALSETSNKIKGFEVGGVDYITKPIEQREVLARIQTHLSIQKMRQSLLNQNQKLQAEIQHRIKIESQLQQRTLELEQTLKQLNSIRLIQEKIRDRLDESQILETATQELVKLLQVDSCLIELYNPQRTITTITYECTHNLPQLLGMRRKIADCPQLYQQLLQKVSLQLTQELIPFQNNRLYVTGLACPIFENHAPEGVLGNLWLFRPLGQIFTPTEINLVQQIASQCAIAIRQARLYKASQQQVKELEKLNRIKDDFLKTISHELRAPMSSIQLAIQTLNKLFEQEGKLKSPLFNKVLGIFRQASHRQKQLVDDLLSLCYIDAKAEVIVTEAIDLYYWIPELVQLFIPQTEAQQQQLVINLPPRLPELKSDISTLERVFKELLNNACKYTPAGEKITVSAQTDEGEIILSISNSGVEIPPEEQEKIFTQFYRIPNNDPWQYGGTGLGLTLVKKLVEILGASINVISHNGETTFSVKFTFSVNQTAS